MANKFNYARAVNTASKLIKKFGNPGTFQKIQPTGGKPNYLDIPVDIVVLDYDVRQVDGTRITSKDKLIYVAAKGLSDEISVNDRIRDFDGKVYEIIPPVRPLNPAGTLVYYEIQGRR